MVEGSRTERQQSTAIAAWAELERNRHHDEPEYHQLVTIVNLLESVIKGETQFSGTATSITEPYSLRGPHQLHDVRQLWSIFCSAARALGREAGVAGRLAKLLMAIHDLPDHAGAGLHWVELPNFATVFGECLRIHGVDGPEQVSLLLNATTFAAELLSRAPFDTVMIAHATQALSRALEDHMESSEKFEQVYLPAAETWVRIAGKQLYHHCQGSCGETSHTVDGSSWSNDNELSSEKWNVWKKRFGELAEDSNIGDEAGGLAASSVVVMDELDGTTRRVE